MKTSKKYSKAKPSMSKAKAMVSKSKKAATKSNKDTYYLKAKVVAVVTPTQGTTVSNYISWWVQLASLSTNVAVTQNSDFKLYSSMYDQVRINSVKVTFTPKANMLDQRQAQNDALVNASGDGLVHTCIDRDDQPPASVARITRYPSYRKHSVLKTFSRTYSVKYPSDIWLDAQNPFADTTLLTRLGLTGGIYLYAENLLEDNSEIVNEPWATCSIEYGCVFRGKTSANLSYDPMTGSVTLTPTQPGQILANSSVQVLYGTIADSTVDQTGSAIARVDSSVP